MKEEKKKECFEPVFICEDTARKAEVMQELNFQIVKMQEFLPLLKEANILPTYEILMDCLTICKEERRTFEEPKSENNGKKEFGTLSYVFTNCEHIDNEFAKQITLVTEGKPKVIAEGFKAEIERTAGTLKEGAFKVFQNLGKLSKERTTEAEKYFTLVEGKITLPEDIEERVARDTGVWCTTEAQTQAYEAHKQAATAITDFLARFPKEAQPTTTAEIAYLFKFGENGSVEPQTIDYSLYIK